MYKGNESIIFDSKRNLLETADNKNSKIPTFCTSHVGFTSDLFVRRGSCTWSCNGIQLGGNKDVLQYNMRWAPFFIVVILEMIDILDGTLQSWNQPVCDICVRISTHQS